MRISRKFNLAFGALLVVTLLLGMAAYTTGQQTVRLFEQTEQQGIPIVIATANAETALFRMLSGVRGHLALSDAGYDRYLSDYEAARVDFEREIAILAVTVERSSDESTQANLATLQQTFDTWSDIVSEIFRIHADLELRSPAYRLFNSDVSEQVRELERTMLVLDALLASGVEVETASVEGDVLIRQLLEFRITLTGIIDKLRAFALTGNESFLSEYQNLISRNQTRIAIFERSVNIDLLYDTQRETLVSVIEQYEGLLSYGDRIIGLQNYARAREDLFLFTQTLVPQTLTMSASIANIANSKRELLSSDIAKGIQQLNTNQQETLLGLSVAMILTFGLLIALRKDIIKPIQMLTGTFLDVQSGRLDMRSKLAHRRDELGILAKTFNTMTARLESNVRSLEDERNQLERANLRMEAELGVVKRLQEMIQPNYDEFQTASSLDIAGLTLPADEVGGDYYDVLRYGNRVKLTIGDVTGHGLESGVVMLMVQAAVRTLMISGQDMPALLLSNLNSLVFDNLERMGVDLSVSFAVVDCDVQGDTSRLRVSGQHESLLLVRQGNVTVLDTQDWGFPLGLVDDVRDFVKTATFNLMPGDGLVLYTDGITEAENARGEFYGLARLCELVERAWDKPAETIVQTLTTDMRHFVNDHTIYDDVTLLVVKQLEEPASARVSEPTHAQVVTNVPALSY
ncbi:MAG: SpoIIE family protein phosphatase [Deinococcota bacterium]